MLLQIVTACYIALRAVLTVGLLRRVPRAAEQPFVSVVVAARDEARTLPGLIAALLSQTYLDYEVVIVDDRSTDATENLLAEWQARDSRLKVVRIAEVPEGRTPKIHALAQGVAVARGSLLLFTDADCRVPPSWIAGIVGAFQPDVGAVVGYVGLQAVEGSVLEQVQALDYLAMMATMAGATNLGCPVGAAGANLAYRRLAYDQAGGFEQLPAGAVADDMQLLQHVLDRTNWRVAFCGDPGSFVSTDTEPTLKRLLAQRVRWMSGGQEVVRHNLPLLVTSTLIGLLNGMLLSFPILLLRRDLRRALLQALLGRSIADAIHLGVAAVRFRRLDLLPYLPLWILLQVPYTVIVPLYSLGGNWSWKDRAASPLRRRR